VQVFPTQPPLCVLNGPPSFFHLQPFFFFPHKTPVSQTIIRLSPTPPNSRHFFSLSPAPFLYKTSRSFQTDLFNCFRERFFEILCAFSHTSLLSPFCHSPLLAFPHPQRAGIFFVNPQCLSIPPPVSFSPPRLHAHASHPSAPEHFHHAFFGTSPFFFDSTVVIGFFYLNFTHGQSSHFPSSFTHQRFPAAGCLTSREAKPPDGLSGQNPPPLSSHSPFVSIFLPDH